MAYARLPVRRTGMSILKRKLKRRGNKMLKRTNILDLTLPGSTNVKTLYGAAVSTTGAGAASYSFRVNSTWDPDYSGTGTKVLYHDSLAGIWTRYDVYAVAVEITFSNANALPVTFGFYCDGESSAITGPTIR